MTRTTGWIAAATVAAVAVAGIAWRPWDSSARGNADPAPGPAAKPGFAEDRVPKIPEFKPVPVDGERAMKDLKALCDLGPRISGSDAMLAQQKVLTKHFEDCGAKVALQKFEAKQKSQKAKVPMANLIASWNPEKKDRVILCSHYDTRPFASEDDRKNWSRPFASANDGTSGVANLMELARHLKDLPSNYGVDVVLFDGEEYVFDRQDDFFFGSEEFARQYLATKDKTGTKYAAAVLLDLCAHENARLAVEGYSWAMAPNLVTHLWGVAESVGAKSFHYKRGFNRADDVLDDHIALNKAGIPAVDVIDFDYEHWHKITDTPDKCSAKQMAEVGKVLGAWLQVLGK